MWPPAEEELAKAKRKLLHRASLQILESVRRQSEMELYPIKPQQKVSDLVRRCLHIQQPKSDTHKYTEEQWKKFCDSTKTNDRTGFFCFIFQ